MRTLLLAAILLVCVAQGAIAARVACAPDICMVVRCGVTQACRENPHYRVIPHGGYCGCCDLCQKILEENESCPLSPNTGMASSEVCADGLKCDQVKHVCVKASK